MTGQGRKAMLHAQYLLAIILMFTMLAVGVWDIGVTAIQQPENTVSNLIGTWSRDYPMLAIMFGIIIGHLFWPRSNLPIG